MISDNPIWSLLFTILIRCGRNGKSKLVELLKTSFGDYFGAVQPQLFTRSRSDSKSPDPRLLSLIKKILSNQYIYNSMEIYHQIKKKDIIC